MAKKSGVIALAGLSLLGGCKKKKPVTVAPQAQAPTVTQQAPAQPAAAQAPPEVQTPPATTTPAKPEVQEKTVTSQKPKPKRRNPQVTKHTPPPATKPAENATATAKANVPPTNNGQPEISVSMDQTQLARRKQLTEELLQSTEADLKSINRTLTGDETAMVDQARSYMAQSRSAIQDGDLDRANNLAQKAHLLADALTKH